MYKVVFYDDERGESDVENFLIDLKKRSKNNKNARINLRKVAAYIDALEEYGTRIGEPITKHIDGEIWELRPLANRILYAYYKDNTFVLLHHFIKKSNKTPLREIEKAKREIYDYRRRHGYK